MRGELDADRGEVAHDVAGVFIEGDEKGALAAPAGRFEEEAGEGRFAGARAAGDERIGPAVDAAIEHLIQPRDAGGDAFFERLRLRVDAIGGADFDAVRADDKRHLVEHMGRAAVFDHAHLAHRHAVIHALAQHHHAIGHELHEAEALRGGRFVFLDLRREDAGEAGAREPFLDPVKLAALGRAVVEQAQEHVERIQDDQLRAHFARFRLEPREQAGEVKRAGFHRVGAEMRVQEIELLFLQLADLPAEARGVGHHAIRVFLERDKDARRVLLRGAIDQRLKREHGLAAARPADEQRRSSAGESARGDVVEALDAGGGFLQAIRRFFSGQAAVFSWAFGMVNGVVHIRDDPSV